MTHIREGGSITAVVPSSDKCSDSRCICDIDLNVPLHKRLNANLESRVNEDLDSAFLLEPKCGFSWTDSAIDSKVSSCSLTSNVDSSLCLMPVTDERCRELSPSCHEDCRSAQTECEEDRGKLFKPSSSASDVSCATVPLADRPVETWISQFIPHQAWMYAESFVLHPTSSFSQCISGN